MTIAEQLNSIFCQVFDDDSIAICPDTTADDIEGWDSLSHVNLITAVEAFFRIRFSKKELLTFRNVGDLMSSIDAKVQS